MNNATVMSEDWVETNDAIFALVGPRRDFDHTGLAS
jgi:hypothetical protein